MCARKRVPMLAAAVTLLASSTPAYAFDSPAPTAGSAPAAPIAVSHPTGSSDLALEPTAAGVAVGGGALAGWQLRRRSSRGVPNPRPASGS